MAKIRDSEYSYLVKKISTSMTFMYNKVATPFRRVNGFKTFVTIKPFLLVIYSQKVKLKNTNVKIKHLLRFSIVKIQPNFMKNHQIFVNGFK